MRPKMYCLVTRLQPTIYSLTLVCMVPTDHSPTSAAGLLVIRAYGVTSHPSGQISPNLVYFLSFAHGILSPGRGQRKLHARDRDAFFLVPPSKQDALLNYTLRTNTAAANVCFLSMV